MVLALLSVVLSSKKCGGGTTAPPATSVTARVTVLNSWSFFAPQAYNCGSNSGPTIGNNPRFNNGSNSLYANTNKRFTEVWVRDINTNSEFSRKCYTNVNGDAGLDVQIDIPATHNYEVYFKQYDACSTACMYFSTPNGIKGVRLIWTGSKQFTFPNYYITLEPKCNRDYIICN
jgi:hypothetical protein